MKYTVELCIFIGLILAFLRPKWLLYFLIISLLEPSRTFSLGNYVILGTVNVKYYEITLSLIYFGAIWNRKRTIRECIPISMVVFVAFALISLWLGIIARYGESAFNQFRTFYSLGMCAAIPLLFKNTKELRPFAIFFFVAVSTMSFIEILGVVGYSRIRSWSMSGNRYTSLLSATQGAMLAMPFIYILSTLSYLKKEKIIVLLGGTWCFLASVLSGSRGVLLGIIGSTAGVASLLSLKRKLTISILIFLLVIFAFVFAKSFYIPRYDMTLSERFATLISKTEGTARWRMDAWRQMLDDIKDKPFLGCPFGTPSTFYVSHVGIEESAPHNEYLKITRYTGLFGFGAFIWFLISIFLFGFQSLRRLKNTKEYHELLGYMMCFLFHVITALFTQAFTTMDRSPIVWALPGIMMLYRFGITSLSSSRSGDNNIT